MIFTVTFEKPGHGSIVIGAIPADNQKSAHTQVLDALKAAGIPNHRMALVIGNSRIEIGSSVIVITPMKEFNVEQASAVATLL